MNAPNFSSQENNLDLRELIKPYVKHWKWFVLSILIAIALGILNIRYAVPQYAIEAKIQILEDQNSASELDVFRDLQAFGAGGSNIEDEIEVLKSRSNLIDIVKELGINKKILALGNITTAELYNDAPFKLNFIAHDSIILNAKTIFFITLSTNTSFEFANSENEPIKVQDFGKPISTAVGDVIVTPNR